MTDARWAAIAVLAALCALAPARAERFPLLDLKRNGHDDALDAMRSLLDARPPLRVQSVAPRDSLHAVRRRTAEEAADSWTPLRLHFDYRYLSDYTPPDQKKFLMEKLMPSVATVIGSALEAKVTEPPFRVPTYDFGGIPIEFPEAVYDTDMLMAVATITEADGKEAFDFLCPVGRVAAAMWTYRGEVTSRPVVGITWICQYQPTFDMNLHTLTHEIMHAIGFSPSLLAMPDEYVFDEDAASNFIESFDGRDWIVSPRVREYMRAFFDCPELVGAPLEDDGGEGSERAHWESRLFEGDVMNFQIGNHSQHAMRPAISALTLAYFEDTEWYNADFNFAGMLTYGYKAGCTLVTGSYEDALAEPDAAYYLCEDEEISALMCLHDAVGAGICSDQDPMHYDNYTMLAPNYFSGAGDCTATLPGTRCLGYQDPLAFLDSPEFAPSCRKMSCDLSTGAVLVDGVPCEATLGKQGWECPDQEKFCGSPGWLTCTGALNDCNAHGDCFKGRCYCHLGYFGDDCRKRPCVGQCPDGSDCPTSGFCGVTRQPTESFEEHIRRVYRVEPRLVPDDWVGLSSYGEDAGPGTYGDDSLAGSVTDLDTVYDLHSRRLLHATLEK